MAEISTEDLHRCEIDTTDQKKLAEMRRIEERTRSMFDGPDLPDRWHLNTCLVNLYGSRREGEKWIDVARDRIPLSEKVYTWWSYRAADWTV